MNTMERCEIDCVLEFPMQKIDMYASSITIKKNKRKKAQWTYQLWWIRSTRANCDALNLYNTTKNCILYRPVHSRSESRHQHLLMRLLYLAMDYRMVDNNLIDMMNHLVLNYQVSQLQYQHYNISTKTENNIIQNSKNGV